MKGICIDNTRLRDRLTLDREYELKPCTVKQHKHTTPYVKVVSDFKGYIVDVSISRFKILEEE